MQTFTPGSIWPPRISSDRIKPEMWKTIPFKGCVYFAFGLNLILSVLIFTLKGFLPPVVPLFYGLPVGADQLVPSLALVIAPVTGLIITLINIFIVNLTRDNLLKKALIISGTFVSTLLAITVVKIILLVGFF